MIIDELKGIKKQARLALPEDDTYLYRLGVALYGFASINSFMTEIICHIDNSKNRIALINETSRNVLDIFRQTLKMLKTQKKHKVIHNIMQQTADLFEKLNTQRNDFVHPYPITNKKSEQILHRRVDDKGKYFEVDNAFLDQFIRELHKVSSGLYEIRRAVKLII